MIALKVTTPRLVSKIGDVLAEKGMSDQEFIARCTLIELSRQTIDRLLDGETGIRLHTLAQVAGVLEVDSLDDLIELQ